MKTLRLIASAIAIALAAPLAAAPGSVRDFQLRPSPTPTATPQVQGPVDVEGIPVAPRVIVRPTPAATATNQPSVAPSPAPSAAPSPTPRQTGTPRPSGQTAASSRQTQPASRETQPAPAARQPEPVPTDATTGIQQGTDENSLQSEQVAAAPNPDMNAQPSGGEFTTPTRPGEDIWLGGLILVIGFALLCLGGFLFWRKRQSAEAVPQIELPLVRQVKPEREEETNGNEPHERLTEDKQPAPQFSSAKAKFQAKVAAQSLSRSVMNATLVYHLELQNLGSSKIEDISVYADVVSAHGKAPVDEQLASENSRLAFASFVSEVRARDAQEVKGEFRLPLSQIKTIAQGSAKLFVPLLRLRIEAEGIETIIQTFVVGVRPEGAKGKLLPFRLDEMAQTYRNIGLRQLG